MVLGFLSNFDLFQQPIKFYFNGHAKLFSSLGILSSLALYGFLLFSFINSDLFKKQEPIIITQSLQMPKAEKVEFTPNITLSFTLADYLGNRYWDPTYFSILAEYYNTMSSLETKVLRNCDENFNNQSQRMGTNSNNTLCLSNNTFTLQGSLDDSLLSYLVITLSPCDNKTLNNTCKTPEEINHYMDSYPLTKYFALRYHDAKTDQNNYERPFQQNSNVEFQYMDSRIQRNWNLYFKNAQIETDDGWFLPSKKILTDIMLDSKTTDFRLRSNSDAFFKVILFASKDKFVSTRRYKKLPEVLAELSGMAQFFLTFFGFVVRTVLYIGTLNQVMKHFYVFPKISKKKKSKKNSSIKGKKRKSQMNKSQKADPPIKTDENTLIKDKIVVEEDKNKKINNLNNAENKSNYCEINMHKNFNDNDLMIKNNGGGIEIIENKAQIFLETNSKEIENIKNEVSPNHLQPKVLEDDIIIAESISLEKHIPIETHSICDKLPNIISKTNTNPIDFQISSPSGKKSEILENNGLNYTFSKENKKSIFSKFIDSSKKLSHMISGVSVLKMKNQTNSKEFHLSFVDYLYFRWCKIFKYLFNKKLSYFHEIIEQAEITYLKDMDSMNLLKTHHDLEKLKMLVLNEDQLILFNFLSKPLITARNNNLVESSEVQQYNTKISNLIRKQTTAGNFFEESYVKVLKNQEKNEINARLIDLLDLERKRLGNNNI